MTSLVSPLFTDYRSTLNPNEITPYYFALKIALVKICDGKHSRDTDLHLKLQQTF